MHTVHTRCTLCTPDVHCAVCTPDAHSAHCAHSVEGGCVEVASCFRQLPAFSTVVYSSRLASILPSPEVSAVQLCRGRTAAVGGSLRLRSGGQPEGTETHVAELGMLPNYKPAVPPPTHGSRECSRPVSRSEPEVFSATIGFM